jgi:hypothetical protein
MLYFRKYQPGVRVPLGVHQKLTGGMQEVCRIQKESILWPLL